MVLRQKEHPVYTVALYICLNLSFSSFWANVLSLSSNHMSLFFMSFRYKLVLYSATLPGSEASCRQILKKSRLKDWQIG